MEREGSFSNDDGDGNENVKKAINLISKTTTLHAQHTFLYISLGLISKTTTLHAQHTFLYISLPSPHDNGVEIPSFTFYGGRKQATINFSFSFKTWMWSPRNQLQGNSPTFDIFRELELARQSLKKREFILKVTFSLPSPSVDKLPRERESRGEGEGRGDSL